ncbi:MAG: DEAD/DEAH box helicase [Armatimonadota bacterium]
MFFQEFPLHEQLQRALLEAGFETATPIQEAALPVALEGHDIVGTAQTGTGKTAAFVLPILHRLMTPRQKNRHTRALILTPTRELAEQIHEAIVMMAARTDIRSATVYGGVGMVAQERALRNGTEIIVACPGRLLDHVQRGNTNFDRVDTLVLDEADRMLDMGFLPPITRIIGLLPTQRQTMLFSATFAPELNKLVDKSLRAPQRIAMGTAAPAETVEHALYPVPQHLKTALLMELLKRIDTESVLIFTRTKHRANRIMQQLGAAGHDAGVLHSNKSQNQRQLALDNFRAGKLQILVATDIAARGIDVATISHVINYDVPDCADAYIHRIGRTGRAERDGEALTFVTTADGDILRDIERALGARIEQRRLEGFDYSRPAPKGDEFARAPQPPRRPRVERTDSKPLQPERASRPAAARPAAVKSAGNTRPAAKPAPRKDHTAPRDGTAVPRNAGDSRPAFGAPRGARSSGNSVGAQQRRRRF